MSNDAVVKQLLEIAGQKKKEIEKIEKPEWKTNCSFPVNENTRVNLQATTSIYTLVSLYSELILQEEAFNKANEELGTKEKFKLSNFSKEEWKNDFMLRIAKINIKSKKDELEKIEEKLSSLISPELRAQMEIEEIKKQLGI